MTKRLGLCIKMAVTPKQFMQNFSAKAWKSELESPFDCLIYNPICVQQIMDLKNLNTCRIWTTEQTMKRYFLSSFCTAATMTTYKVFFIMPLVLQKTSYSFSFMLLVCGVWFTLISSWLTNLKCPVDLICSTYTTIAPLLITVHLFTVKLKD